MPLKIGDTVQLKSGGPVMTVLDIDAANNATCLWYASPAGEFRTYVFPTGLLDEVEFEEDDED
jgi:uncharacterized protein YodC (DUF2158 family)